MGSGPSLSKKILAIIIIGTLSTLVFVAYVMEKIINLEKNNVKRR